VPALIEVRHLRAWYGPIHAVHHVDLDVHSGEIVALLGANGAGKTTTLTSIAGLHPSRRGTIVFDGSDVSRVPPEKLVRRGISLAPEGRRIFATLSVAENLAIGAAARKGRAARREILGDRDRLLTLFPVLAQRLNAPGGTLSGGEQQQLAIARALMSRPRVLLLDEPSLGLAPKIVQLLFELIVALRDDQGVTILLVEQNIHGALGVCDRAYVMQSGTIALSGTAAELRHKGDIEEAYLGLSADTAPKGGAVTRE
jgi:branched-chain amino acid transport system ATP-binding protein